MQPGAKEQIDGRTVRAQRTRQALLDALFSLLEDGELRPTAERIAERAGVSERSVFQHFPDREALYEAVGSRQFERVLTGNVPVDPSRPLAERVETFVAQRCAILEQVTPVARAALLLEAESGVVAGWLETFRRAAAAEVGRVFGPELEQLERRERSVLLPALVSAATWPVWEGYRAHQGLGVERARAAMCRTLAALLGER
jgi:TetR/AcrR family transcriptional regulator, regulator of autoinduction and epiphytic fitness